MPKRKRNLSAPPPKVAAALKALRDLHIGPRPLKFQDLADGLAASGCTISDFQKAAIVFDDLMMWEQEISDLCCRLLAKGVSLPEGFTYEELFRIAIESGDQSAQRMVDADVINILKAPWA
ncbi:hypothetical protein [Bradyrhizobium erythrophlei]|uniref:Uncharacterized protein n=1 Tax=Bradyrhizobium erythrophlei TaxID=1437360 RepID=A0A1M7UUR5_9BRAD|nr:hypothetical protein [Bradyrhizobium erythrophlei]SHN86781.1 hypothetical protein SAMN05444170_6830 [Bradyrhizobium erythrophlei]